MGVERQRYFGEFKSVEDVIREFSIEGADNVIPKDEEILLAVYEVGGYDGSARVFFRRDKKLYEVSGSHCSCFGLEGQWEPHEVLPEQLRIRPIEDDYTMGYFSEAIALYRKFWPKMSRP